jgi:hypothetical protein
MRRSPLHTGVGTLAWRIAMTFERKILKVPGAHGVTVALVPAFVDNLDRSWGDTWSVYVGGEIDETYYVCSQVSLEEAVAKLEQFLGDVQNALIDLKYKTPNEIYVRRGE